jgi:hypothetical protein
LHTLVVVVEGLRFLLRDEDKLFFVFVVDAFQRLHIIRRAFRHDPSLPIFVLFVLFFSVFLKVAGVRHCPRRKYGRNRLLKLHTINFFYCSNEECLDLFLTFCI